MENKIVRQLKRSNGKYWLEVVRTVLSEAWRAWDCDVVLTVTPDKLTRSQKQNRLLWKWHNEFVNHLYMTEGKVITAEQWHELFKTHFVGTDVVELDGASIVVPRSTTKLKVGEMKQVLDKYEAEAANRECMFTRPDDLYWDSMMKGEKESETSGM